MAEGADVPLSRTVPDASSRCPPEVCVAAVLGDALRRVSVLGGREGMPRSLGSVYGGSVTRFLNAGLRDVASRVIDTRSVKSSDSGVAVSRDGSTLLVSNIDAIHEFSVADGSRLRVSVPLDSGQLQFNCPRQMHIAPDGFVFLADASNNRVLVLTRGLDVHAVIGVRDLTSPAGVCANADVVVVSEWFANRVSVFNRHDGATLRRFGRWGRGVGQLDRPAGLCFVSCERHVAVADSKNNRVSVFSVDGGVFVRHVGVGALHRPLDVACSAFDQLVVADTGNARVVLFSASGEVVMALGHDRLFTGVAVHGTVFAKVGGPDSACAVFAG